MTTEARFACAVCGREAGTIELRGDELRRESFTGVLTRRVGPGGLERLSDAVSAGDAAAIHALDLELARTKPRSSRRSRSRSWGRRAGS